MSQSARGSGSAPALSGVVIGPDAAFIGIGCIAVATAQLLGVSWLREPVLDIPTGLWLIAGGWGLMHLIRSRAGRSSMAIEHDEVPTAVHHATETPASAGAEVVCEDQPDQLRFPFGRTVARSPLTESSPDEAVAPLWQNGSLLAQAEYRLAAVDAELPSAPGAGGRLVLGITGAMLRFKGVGDAPSSGLASSLSNWHDSWSWPERPLRVGLDLHSDLAAHLIRAAAGLGFEWVPVAAGGEDQRECASKSLDGIVRMDAVGDVRFCSAEHPSREAGWYDWARPMPLSYSAVFPTRVDPCMVTLSRGWGFEAKEARLIARLIQAAAIFARSRVRLGLSERLRGRRPLDLGDVGTPASFLRASGRTVVTLSNLAESICTERSGDPIALKAAARVVGAWAATTDVPVDPDLRREAAEAALRILPDEPEAILRAVATRFAAYDDRAAFEGLVDAQRAIRAAEHGPILDPLAFLEAEIELGLPGPMTFGRVAAGLCLVGSTTEDAKLDYVCDDLVEEMRYSGWLIGRDADRRVLIEVMRTVQQARKGEPAREAA